MARRTHLYSFHSSNGRIIEFAGFDMPIWYRSIVSESLVVRKSVGIFDVSHMGRALITGDEAEPFLNHVTTNDVASLRPGQGHYSLMCNERGGIVDDVVVLRPEQTRFVVVFNAGNREKDFNWVNRAAQTFRVEVEDVSDRVALFAVQGPQARGIIESVTNMSFASLARFGCSEANVEGVRCLVSRTGYTGEDGFEVFVWDTSLDNPDKAVSTWNAILQAGAELGIQPCGLGARDVLRLEAGMCLYGADIDESITPIEARLGFTVKLQKGSFIGGEALAKQKSEGVKRVRIGLKLLGRGIPRPGHEIIDAGAVVGKLTSGTLSPTLNVGIAMGYVPPQLAEADQTLTVKLRERLVEGKVVRFPFYSTKEYGFARQQAGYIPPPGKPP